MAAEVPQVEGGGSGWKLVYSDLSSDSVALRSRGLAAALSRHGRISAGACKPIATALVRGVSAADPAALRATIRQVRAHSRRGVARQGFTGHLTFTGV